MSRSYKLYVVTRQDLPPGVAASMLVHSTARYVETYAQPDIYVNSELPVVLLYVEDEVAMHRVLSDLHDRGIQYVYWLERDLDYQLASIAAVTDDHTALGHLPLFLSQLQL